MSSNIPHYQAINEYLKAAGCSNRTHRNDFYILRFSELSHSTVQVMKACQKSFYQINFIKKAGKGAYWFNAKKKPQQDNTLFFVSPEHIYSWIRDEQLEGYLLYFKPTFLSLSHFSYEDCFSIFNVKKENTLSIKPLHSHPIEHFFQLLHTYYHNNSTALSDTLMSLLYYSKALKEKQEEAVNLNRAQTYFEAYQNMVNNLFLKERSVQFYAHQLHISPNYLNSICKAQSDKSAKEMIQERLLVEAIFLLKNTHQDVSEIAFLLGFLPTHFTRFFKKHIGCSPSTYRNS